MHIRHQSAQASAARDGLPLHAANAEWIAGMAVVPAGKCVGEDEMDVAPTLKEPLDRQLCQLAEQAIEFHARMSGNADAPERFIQASIARELCCQQSFRVGLEVDAMAFRQHCISDNMREAFDSLRPKLPRPNFKLDIVLWRDDKLQALIEVKKGSPLSTTR